MILACLKHRIDKRDFCATAAAVAVLFCTLVAQAPAAHASTPQADFLAGVTLLHKGAKSRGYQKLESAFEHASDAKLKTQTAFILAFASSRDVKKKKHYEYAELCLKYGAQTLSPKDHDSLTRIAGDGYFESANFIKSESYFKELEKSSDPASVNYAAYKRGWIYLNQKQATLAFELWHKHLFKQTGTPITDLKLAILQDLGRAWAESNPPNYTQDEAILGMGLSENEKQKFIEGTALGARRFQSPKELEAFREHLYKTEFALPVFQRMLGDGMGFKNQPCHVLNWAEPVDVSKVSGEEIIPLLNLCYKWLSETYAKDWKAHAETDRLLEVSKKVDIRGLARWGRAELYKETGDLGASCSEYLKMATEHLTLEKTEGKPLPQNALEAVYHACQKYADLGSHNPYSAIENSNALMDLLRLFAEKKLIAQNPKHPLYELAHLFQNVEGFSKSLIEKTLDNTLTFQPTLIPTLAGEAALKEKYPNLQANRDLLSAFAPKPFSGSDAKSVWFELLRSIIKAEVQKSNFDLAQEDLQNFIPLETKSIASLPLSELWLFWALSLPADDTSHLETGKKMVASLASLAPALSQDQRLSLMALAIKYEELAAIWKQWPSFDGLSSDGGKVLALFLDKSFEQALAGKIAIKQLPQDARLKPFKTAANAAFTQSLQADSAELLTKHVNLPAIEKTLFWSDAKMISGLFLAGKKLNAKPLRFNAQIAKEIESALKALRQQVEQIRTREWSHPNWASLSKRTVAENCDLLRHRIENIQKPKWLEAQHEEQLKQQLKPVIDTLLEWKETLQGAVQASSKQTLEGAQE